MSTRLPRMDVGPRAGRVRVRMEEEGCEALLVTNPFNIRYVSGFTGSAGLLLVLPDELLLVTDGRYELQSAEELAAAGVEARIHIGRLAAQQEAISTASHGIGKIGLEAGHVSWARQRAMAEGWFPAAELIATEGLVEGVRRVKDPGELARLGEAARIADEALGRVLHLLADGVSEVDMAIALDFEMRRLGAEGPSFETIVASGRNGAKPHARPSPRRIGSGELVVIDFGALVDGYHSDMTRTFCVGEPDAMAARMFEVVAASQRAGVAAVRAGVAAADVDRTCRDLIAEAGWAAAFGHGTGHGVGLEIHEAPAVGTTSTDTLDAGAVVTVEPGVYLPDHGGVRIEDTLVVTTDGSVALTSFPKDLVVA